MVRTNNPEDGDVIIDLRKMDEITPKGCQGLLTRIIPPLRVAHCVPSGNHGNSQRPFRLKAYRCGTRNTLKIAGFN